MGELPRDARSMRWGIKESFLQYVRRSGGDVTLVQPAAVEDTAFFFPRRPAPSHEYGVLFSGGVVLSAHGSMMRVLIAEPGIETVDGELMLTIGAAADPYDLGARRPIARLTPAASAGAADAVSFEAALAWSGVGLFGDSYPEGTAFDMLTVDIADRPGA